MSLPEVVGAILRRWWLVLLVPFFALAIILLRSHSLPYRTTVRASVLIPGDTETPGNAERPELMVLDDLPSLISSQVFAEGVVAQLEKSGTILSADDVKGDLSGSRYSRILTVDVTDASKTRSSTIAEGVAAVLPAMVNKYLIADGGLPATVQIIDPPGDPTRSRANQKLIIAGQLIAALAVGALLAVLYEAFTIWRADQTLSPATRSNEKSDKSAPDS